MLQGTEYYFAAQVTLSVMVMKVGMRSTLCLLATCSWIVLSVHAVVFQPVGNPFGRNPNIKYKDKIVEVIVPKPNSLPVIQSRTAQSSTSGSRVAGLAVDGNNNPDAILGKSCSETMPSDIDPEMWWSLDLKAEREVIAVNIANRGDCCGWQLEGAGVYVLAGGGKALWPQAKDDPATLCGYVEGTVDVATESNLDRFVRVECSGAVTGRFLYIAAAEGVNSLSLCEVEVFVLEDGVEYVDESAKKSYSHTSSLFGVETYSVSGHVVLAEPKLACPTIPISDGYPGGDLSTVGEDLKTDCRGKILLAQRGGCSFFDKALLAQQRGAAGIIIGNNRKENHLFRMTWPRDEVDGLPEIVIPVVFVELTAYDAMKKAVQNPDLPEYVATLQGPSALDIQWDSTDETAGVDLSRAIEQLRREMQANRKNQKLNATTAIPEN